MGYVAIMIAINNAVNDFTFFIRGGSHGKENSSPMATLLMNILLQAVTKEGTMLKI